MDGIVFQQVSRHTIMSHVKCDYSSLEIENVTQIESSLLQVMYRQVILFPTFSRRDLVDREYNLFLFLFNVALSTV